MNDIVDTKKWLLKSLTLHGVSIRAYVFNILVTFSFQFKF